MQIKIFSIPIYGGEALEQEMNKFLRSRKIIDVESELLRSERGGNHWTFCVRYAAHSGNSGGSPKKYDKPKVDYQKTLDDSTYERFMVFRKIRMKIAKEDAVPAFAVFTDAELSELAKLKEINEVTMKAVEGIGKKKIEKYAAKFVQVLQERDKK